MAPKNSAPLESTRIDRWLSAVRIFKTRSLASDALNGGKIKLNGVAVKPNKTVKIGDSVSLKKEGRTYAYEVLGIIEKRVGAAIAETMYNLTVDADLPEDMRELTQLYHSMQTEPKRRGKPSKKDRRLIEKLKYDH